MQTPFPNQPPPFEGCNPFDVDCALREAVERTDPAATSTLREWGAVLGSADTHALAAEANRNAPILRTYDRSGERIDEVQFHPAWHALMSLAARAGEHCSPWQRDHPTSHALRAARYYLHAQVENGTQCPLTMTYASVPVLQRHSSGIPGAWLARTIVADYDPRALPIEQKRAALIGMGMTERQGGSDVRANRTTAELTPEGTARLTGHKWFFSAPQCDAHLVLAQAPQGLSCFLVPRLLDDGSRNAIRINRLKDKLGNRSNASSEVEFDDAHAWPIGPEGRGVATIIEMVQHTRLDCVIGSAGMMRGALALAIHNATHRVAFGRRLRDQPLMRNVLADLALESEAALALAMRLARCLDTPADHSDRAFARLAIPAAKYWVCKRACGVVGEAMEALGGNGYVEEHPMPRLYREAPVNSIWEGSGNVIALDVARAAEREPAAVAALTADIDALRGGNRWLDAAAARLKEMLAGPTDPSDTRRLAQLIATVIAGAELLRYAPPAVADGYCASRLGDETFGGAAYGTLAHGIDLGSIVTRAFPEQDSLA
ncbi:MAG TPA: isovaleryl-CoA dehydrogenase [Casimicrobiaceae bacterium]|nr:isovaleryl-CoA dehydrogenase [Casimicrobiaceae bacterium]